MKRSFKIKAILPVSPSLIYKYWLDSEQHSLMTGGFAQINDLEGNKFSAWNGYIKGKNLKLIPGELIIQEWRTQEFNESDPSSILKIKLNKTVSGAELVIEHSEIPPGQPDYKQGWLDFYIAPMKKYFSQLN